MNSSSTASIRVGVITDMTGPLSLLGVANANIAKMVIDDINSKGGLLGRPLNLHLEDSATTDSVAEAKSRKLVLEEKVRRASGRHLQLDAAGDQGPGGRGQEALPLSGAIRGAGMPPAHLLHRPGPGAAGGVADPVADAEDGSEEILLPVGRIYLAAHHE